MSFLPYEVTHQHPCPVWFFMFCVWALSELFRGRWFDDEDDEHERIQRSLLAARQAQWLLQQVSYEMEHRRSRRPADVIDTVS